MATPPSDPTHASVSAPRRFLTVPQVAEELSVSVSQVYALLRDRSLPAIKVGGRGQWRIERDRLEAYIERAYADGEAAVTAGDLTTDS